jgi:cation transport ATPase
LPTFQRNLCLLFFQKDDILSPVSETAIMKHSEVDTLLQPEKRIPITLKPKISDNTPEQRKQKKQIATETFYVFKSQAKNAVDGMVISGNSYVDESMLSGEPVPVLKKRKSICRND